MDRHSSFKIKRLFAAALAALTAASCCACGKVEPVSGSSEPPSYTDDMTYAQTLFDASRVHEIDISISEEDWADLTADPQAKTKYNTAVTIDGEKLEGVGFSTKGNTSLAFVAQKRDSSRYSFKLNFGKYADGQTYRGLNKLNLNNLYADATYMKDYLSYEIMREAGVNAPLTSYVWVSVNGEALGLYIAIEDVSESYLDRTADGEGELYKPETEQLDNIGGGQSPDASGMPQSPDASGMPQTPDASGMPQPPAGGFPGGSEFPGGEFPGGSFPGGDFPGGDFPGGTMPGNMPSNMPGDMPGDMPGNMPGGFGGSGSGASLVYTDDELSSYSDIFDNDVTDADEESNRRVIEALKGLASGENVSDYIDVEEVASYFAAHNFVLNYDSYTGSMLHNYYLCENEGKLSMLPWDYNLAFGSFMGTGDTTSLINTGIDAPLSGASEEQRPMWAAIANDEEALALYHEAYDKLLTNYFESGRFEESLEKLHDLIAPYIAKDPSAFYTAEEFEKAYETLKSFCLKRAESIRKQLDGSLSASTNEQDAAARVDASDIDISVMGSHGGGNQGGGPGGNGQGFPGGDGGQGFPGGSGGPGGRP